MCLQHGYNRDNIDDCVSKQLKKPNPHGEFSLEVYLQQRISPGILADFMLCLTTPSGTIAKQIIKADEERKGRVVAASTFFRQIERFSGFGAQLLDALHYDNQHDLADMIYKGAKYTPPTVGHSFHSDIQQLSRQQFPVLPPPPYEQVDASGITIPKTLADDKPSPSGLGHQLEGNNKTHKPIPLTQTKCPPNMEAISRDTEAPGILESVALEPSITEIAPQSNTMESSGPVMVSTLSDVVEQSKANSTDTQIDVDVTKSSEAGGDLSPPLPCEMGQQPGSNNVPEAPTGPHPNDLQSTSWENQSGPDATLKHIGESEVFEAVPAELSDEETTPRNRQHSGTSADLSFLSHDKGENFMTSITRGALLFLTLDDHFS